MLLPDQPDLLGPVLHDQVRLRRPFVEPVHAVLIEHRLPGNLHVSIDRAEAETLILSLGRTLALSSGGFADVIRGNVQLYTLIFTCAPLVHSIIIPVMARLPGRRRGLPLFSQFLLMVVIVFLGSQNPVAAPGLVAFGAVLVAAASATQDIVIDAWRIEAAEDVRQGALAAAYHHTKEETFLKAADAKDALDPDVRPLLIDLFKRRADKRMVPYLWHVSEAKQYPEPVRAKARAALAYLTETELALLPPAKMALTDLAEVLDRAVGTRLLAGRPPASRRSAGPRTTSRERTGQCHLCRRGSAGARPTAARRVGARSPSPRLERSTPRRLEPPPLFVRPTRREASMTSGGAAVSTARPGHRGATSAPRPPCDCDASSLDSRRSPRRMSLNDW